LRRRIRDGKKKAVLVVGTAKSHLGVRRDGGVKKKISARTTPVLIELSLVCGGKDEKKSSSTAVGGKEKKGSSRALS